MLEISDPEHLDSEFQTKSIFLLFKEENVKFRAQTEARSEETEEIFEISD